MITASHIYASGQAANSGVTTPSLSFGDSKLDILAVINTRAASLPNAPTVTMTGRTWTQIATVVNAANNWRITFFRSMGGAASGGVTIDFAAQTQDNYKFTFEEFSGVVTTGTNGADAVVQNANNNNSGTQTGIVVTLAALGNANNATYGCIGRSTATTISMGTGFSALLAFDSGLFGDQSEWQINDNTVDWTWASESANSIAMAIEIKALITAASSFLPFL